MSSTSTGEREDQLLGGMMKYLMQGKEGVSFKQLSKDLGFMERTKSWRNSWKDLVEDKGLIEAAEGNSSMYSGDYQLTQAGKDHASTPEYQQYLEEMNFVPQSNEQHKEHLKKRLLNDKARTMFDSLLKYGALTRTELALIVGVNDRSHAFSYGLKDLKTKELVKVVAKSSGKGKGLILTDKAFLDQSDRPATQDLDASILEKGKKMVESRKRKQSDDGGDVVETKAAAATKKGKKKKKAKKELSAEENEEDFAEDEDTASKSKESASDDGDDEGNNDEAKEAAQSEIKSEDEDTEQAGPDTEG